MTDKKISALTASTTPLGGTELVPIVQSNATVNVTVANLTAGRAVSMLNLTSTNDSIVNGLTVGKGNNAIVSNTSIGYQALNTVTTGNTNVAVGYQAAKSLTTGQSCVAVGELALLSNQNGSSNLAIGEMALLSNVDGSNNTAIGSGLTGASFGPLGSNVSGGNNTAVGTGTFALSTGGNGTAVGANAGYSTTGSSNSFFGYNAGTSVTSGAQNVIIGSYTGSAAPISATGSNHIVFSDGAANVRGYYDNNGNLIVPVAGKGVNFTANTPAAGMTSQLLNWYEEGTWTPAITFGGGSTALTATAVGIYTRIGRQVSFSLQVTFSNKGSSTGGASISGLPFASNGAATQVFFMQGDSLTFSGSYVMAYLATSSTALGLYTVASGTTTQLTDAEFANNTLLRISGSYSV